MQQTERAIKKKHDHKLTNYLKAGIFSLIMLAPLMSIGVRCGYVMFNKNAYESYYGETINNELLVNTDLNNLITNEKYTLICGQSENYEHVLNIYLNDLVVNQTSYTKAERISLFYNSTNTRNYLGIYGTNQDTVYLFPDVNNIYNLSFTYQSYTQPEGTFNGNILIKKIEYNKYSYLDNAFDYSVNQLENETFISWTKNTGIYTGITAMTTGLDITNNALAIMLTYWSLMTAIYIIFDIVIGIFTKLTHLFQ